MRSVRRTAFAFSVFLLALAAPAEADIFQFSAGSVSNTRTEGGPSLTLTVERSGGSSGNATISYSVSGTASNGSDFTITPASSVSFTGGVLSRTITLTFPDDLVTEPTETLVVTLDGSNRGTDSIGPNNTATVTILDNDGPGIEINNVALTEGNAGTVVMAFTVQLSETSTQDVMVNYATQNDTAIAPGDYTATSGTLTITAGQQLGIINVSIMSNTVDQIDRSFFVNLSNPVNGNIVDGQGIGTILDDDGPTVSVGDASRAEGNSGTANMSFTVSLSDPSPQQITLQYFTADDTANAGSDYQFRSGMLTFAPGVTTQTILVPIIGDTTVEANEQFFVNLFLIDEAFPGDVQGVGTIVNDDVAGVTVTAAPNLQTTEAGGTATFTIALTSSPTSDVTIALTSSDLTEGTVSPALLTFTPLNALVAQTVTITGVDDLIRDGDIAYTIVTGDASSADPNYDAHVIADVAVTNLDNEADPEVTLSLADSPMAENGGTATVTATLSLESTVDVTVDLAFTGTGTFNTDYSVSASSIVIPAGSLTGSIVISAIDDLLDEPDETVIVDITSVTNGTETSPQQVTAVITDDDDEPSVQFAVDNSSGSESVTPAQLTVTPSAASGRTVTVNYSATGGSATGGGVDYTLAAGMLTFAPGVTSQTIDIAIVDDGIDEAGETIEVTLASPSNATLGAPSLHTYTIDDNDDAPSVGFAVASSSGDEGTTPAQLTVTLSASSGQTITVNYAATGGTATGGGTDYTLASGTLTFAPGVTSQTIGIAIVDDLIDEVNETIIVTLSGETNATLGTSVHTYTILDNDDPPTVSIGDASTTEGGNLVFTVTLTGATSQVVTVGYATADNTAVEPGDYTSAGGTLTFNPGDPLTQTITVVTIDDSIDEPTETMFVNLSGPSNATVADGQGVGTILDNDDAPVLSINDVTVTEGGSAVFTVTLTGGTSQTVTVDFTTADGPAVVADDYVANSGTLTFSAGVTTQTVTVVTVDDAINEPSETFFVNLSNASNATIGDGQGQGTITDNDGVPSVTLSLGGSPFAENGGVATVTATLSAQSGQDITVNLGLSGTATQNVDYTASALSIVITAGNTSGTINLTGIDDAIDELDETVIVDITSVTNGTEPGIQQVTAVIADDDDAPTVTLTQSGSPIAENGGVATVTATLSAASGLGVTVNLSFSGTASAGDYSASGNVINIPAGSLTGSITITGTDDSIDEPDETVVVDIASVVNATEGLPSQATVTITDNDDAPVVSFTAAGQSVSEGIGTVTVTAQLSAVSGQSVTVPYTVSGTAENPVDHDLAAASITIPAGSLTGSVTFSVVDDSINEPDETVILTMGVPTNASAGTPGVHTVTINDNDGVPDVTLSAAPLTIGEAADSSTVTATLSAISGLDVTVNLAFTGTAGIGTDYSASSTSIIIPAGSLSAGITLTAIQDATDEVNETIIVDIDGVTNGSESGEQQVTIEIIDDDAPPTVAFSAATQSVDEGVGSVTVTAVLSAVSSLEVTVPFTVSGTATAGLDHDLVAASITIAAGSLNGNVTFNVVDDSLDEPDETVIVTMGSPTNATPAAPSVQTITITDNDAPPAVTLGLTGSPLAEDGGVATVTATLSAVSSFDVTVNLELSGTASLATDFNVSTQTIVIAAGDTSGTTTITAIQDEINEGDETVIVDIDTVVNGTESGVQQVTATITDDDAVPSLSIADAILVEGDTGSAMMQFTVTLSGASSQDVTVGYQTADATATAGVDYTAASGTLTIDAGLLSGTVEVAILGDEIAEGDETFTVTLSGAVNATIADATAVGTVTDDDAAPVAVNDGFSVDEDTTLTVAAPGVLGNDTDGDGDSLSAGLVSGPASGVLTLNADGSFEYTPNPDFNGTDSFTYTATDGFNTSAAALVTITVDPVNDAPVADDDAYSSDEDVVLTVPAPGVLGNDTDVDGDSLTASLVDGPDAGDGVLVLNGDGSFEFTPAEDFNGTVTFTYLVNDGSVDSNTATVTLTIDPVNDDPVATAGAATTDEDTPVDTDVLAFVTDVDGDTLTVTGSTNGANGTVSCTAAGICTYTPDADFNGTDSYTYTVDDGNGGTVTGTVTVTVNAVNDAPVATADSYTTNENVALSIAAAGVLANDTDVDADALTAVKLSDPANGTVTLNADGSLTYTPNPNFFGSDSFTYAANDGSVNSNEVTVSLTVISADDDPSLSSVAPGSICEGGPEFTLTINGENFVAGSTIEWNGSLRATTFVSGTQLTAVIPASDIATAGTASITVTNPLGGGSSNVMTFTVGEDTVAPTVTAPAEIVIIQTECQAGAGGATAASSTTLADFLGSATAVDACSTDVDQLAPQFEGLDVDNQTFLRGGNNLITFRFVDGAGNIGTADANVRVVLYGDLNEDGSVDATDLVIMANHLVGNIPMGTAPFTAPMELVDLDRNSSLDAVDLVTTAHYLVGNISCLPYASGQ